MSRVYAWIQRHPKIMDSLPALFLILIGMLTVFDVNNRASALDRALAAPLVLLVSAPLIWRRRWPIGTFLFAGTFAFIGLSVQNVGFTGADLAFVIYLYTVAAYRPRRFSLPALLVVYVGGMVQLGLIHAFQDNVDVGSRSSHAFNLTNFVFTAVFYGGLIGCAWVAGDSMRYRREYYVRLEDRAERLERERDAQAQIAAAAERARIARELHDVVAHNVSVMVVQADGAGYALDQDPEAAREALAAISQTGRTALTEMRRMLGVLRSADEASYVPQPGIEQLGDLLEQVRAAGLPVTLTVEGVPREMPTALALAVYRIVQESLTNTRKHGGPDVKARVGLLYTDDALVLRIVDNGRGGAAPTDGMGHGMVGMRERVHVFGGTLVAGEHVAGGYAVEAVLPFAEPEVRPAEQAEPAQQAGQAQTAQKAQQVQQAQHVPDKE